MSAQRYDVIFVQHHTYVEPHFCREWDESGGCHGSNPNHGFTWEEAREEVAKFYDAEAARWRVKTPEEG